MRTKNESLSGKRRPDTTRHTEEAQSFSKVSHSPLCPLKGTIFHCTQPPITTRDLDKSETPNHTYSSLLSTFLRDFPAQLDPYFDKKLQTFGI